MGAANPRGTGMPCRSKCDFARTDPIHVPQELLKMAKKWKRDPEMVLSGLR